MHVVQVAPPWFPIPPVRYGGIERVVYDLTEALVAAGHEVTLLAPPGSQTSARLIPTVAAPLGLNLTAVEIERHFRDSGRAAYEIAADLGADVVHDHTDYRPASAFPLPIVRTVHGPAIPTAVAKYLDMSARGDRIVAISARQRDLFEAAAEAHFGPGRRIGFAAVVHNPIDVASAPFYPASAKEGYAAFVGRCHWEKGPDAAIRIAKAAGVPLKMALRVTSEERPYYEAVVRPLIERNRGLVEFVGEVGGRDKDELIGRAAVVIFSSPWEEPFGLVLAEAAARGTPVVALRRGAAPEIVRDGVTGLLGDDEEDLARLLPEAMRLDPAACRAHVAATFDRQWIAEQYVRVYEAAIAGSVVKSRSIPVFTDTELAHVAD